MWTHINHGSDYLKVRDAFMQIRDYIDRFIQDEVLCPFHPHKHDETLAHARHDEEH
jgi:hypothetical protein